MSKEGKVMRVEGTEMDILGTADAFCGGEGGNAPSCGLVSKALSEVAWLPGQMLVNPWYL